MSVLISTRQPNAQLTTPRTQAEAEARSRIERRGSVARYKFYHLAFCPVHNTELWCRYVLYVRANITIDILVKYMHELLRSQAYTSPCINATSLRQCDA